MGDHGTPYKTCTPALRQGLRELVAQADVITPNLTEAAILLDIPYHESQTADASELVRALSLQGQRSVVLTGYAAAPGQARALKRWNAAVPWRRCVCPVGAVRCWNAWGTWRPTNYIPPAACGKRRRY